MLREKVKLALLLGSYLFCVTSLLTSHKSFQMGPRDLPILQPQVSRYCKSIYKARNQCRKGGGGKNEEKDCPKIIQQANQCASAVKQAYRTINMGGCPYQLRDVTLCELERCGGYHGISVLHTQPQQKQMVQQQQAPLMDALEGCMHHCDSVRKKLDECVHDNVQRKLQKYGIRIEQR